MKTSLIHRTVLIAVMSATLSFSSSVFGSDTNSDMLNQAFDLVHQAWNPSGDAPSNDQRTDLLKQALELAKVAPDHHLRGHRVKAIQEIKAALAELAAGDADHKAVEYIRDADSELRIALSISQ